MAVKRSAEGKGKTSPEKKKKKAPAKATAADKFVPSTELKRAETVGDSSSSASLTVLYWNLGGIKSALKNRSELIARAATNMHPEVICFSEHKVQVPDVPKVEADLLKVHKYIPCSFEKFLISGLCSSRLSNMQCHCVPSFVPFLAQNKSIGNEPFKGFPKLQAYLGVCDR